MSSNQQQQQLAAKSNISPVLFMSVDGEPMSFFLRPGPIKTQLQPLITAGGGLLCGVQQPGAILLIDPEEKGSVSETAAHWYVSTQYIHDCVEKDEQLNVEDYRLNPEGRRRQSARLNNNKESSSGVSEGRLAYTAEEDAAILSYVSKRKEEAGGNRLFQEMEKQRVTSHSWQSMKYRYRVRLAKRLAEFMESTATEEEEEASEGETKGEGNQETDVEEPSSAEDAASPQRQSAETDLTQIDAEITKPESLEAQTSICPEEEVQHVSPQAGEQLAENSQVEAAEAETFNSPQPQGTCLEPPTDAQPVPAESTEPDEAQTQIPQDSPPAQPEPPPDTSAQKKLEEKQKGSPRVEQPQQRVTRRQLKLEEPEPYGKKLRSSSAAEQPSSSPQPSKKTKSAVKSVLQKDSTVDQPPSKRARGRSTAAVAESPQEDSGQSTVSDSAQAETETVSVTHKGEEKKKGKRKLGILEMATKEFEDESESDEDEEASDLQNQTETATPQPTSTEAPAADPAASTQSSPEPEPGLQVTEASRSDLLPPSGRPEPSAAEPTVVNGASKAHLFIFDSESQEEDSQSVISGSTAAPAPTGPDAAFSLTQAQLEEDKQRVRELMKATKQDLATVTKALLKTSGDFSVVLDLLLDRRSVSGPFWTRSDDRRLLSGDPVVRQELQEKFGEESVAKRIVFLEMEG